LSRAGFLAAVVISALGGAFGDIWLYRWARGYRFLDLVFGMALWLLGLAIFAALLRWGGRGLGVTFVFAAVVHIAVVLAYDYLRVGTRWTSAELVGIVLAVIGLVIVDLGAAPLDGER
jgi:hypothetical protein